MLQIRKPGKNSPSLSFQLICILIITAGSGVWADSGPITGWTFSNERITGNEFSDAGYQNTGAYLSVGGDRALTGAALALEAGINITEIIRFDTDQNVLDFGDYLDEKQAFTQTCEDFLSIALSWSATPFLVWVKQSLFQSHLLNDWFGWRTLYTDQNLLNQLREIKKPSNSFILDINQTPSWRPLIKRLNQNTIHIAVLDISNLLQGYATPESLSQLIEALNPHLSKKSLVRETLFFNHLIGHYETRITPVDEFLSTVNNPRPSNIHHFYQKQH